MHLPMFILSYNDWGGDNTQCKMIDSIAKARFHMTAVQTYIANNFRFYMKLMTNESRGEGEETDSMI